MIKKAVALTLREYWRAVHGAEPTRDFPCNYPGFICEGSEESFFTRSECRSLMRKKRQNCWDRVEQLNGKYPIRRVGYKGGAGSDKKN